MLAPDELKRRIDAARTIRGLKQTDLAELVADDGFGKHDVGRLERGDIPLTRALRRSLSGHLGVPERWFVDETLDLTGYEAVSDKQLDRIEDALRTIAETASRERQSITRLLNTQQDLLEAQTRILERMEAVAAGLPADDTLRALTLAARQLEQAAEDDEEDSAGPSAEAG